MIEADEKELIEKAVLKHFYVSDEVKGKHLSGENVRIDQLIVPRNFKEWKNKNRTYFGVEYKKEYNSIGDKTKVIVQALDYRHSKFETKFGMLPVPVFIYPCFMDTLKDKAFYERLLGRLGVGFIEPFKSQRHGFNIKLKLNGTVIYDTLKGDGTETAKMMNFKRKYGSQ